jgi:hypothetical protein
MRAFRFNIRFLFVIVAVAAAAVNLVLDVVRSDPTLHARPMGPITAPNFVPIPPPPLAPPAR